MRVLPSRPVVPTLFLSIFLFALPVGPQARECTVPLVERDGTQLTVRLESIPEHSVRVYPREAGSGVITGLFPLTPGLSGNLVRRDEAGALVVRCADGQVRASVRSPAGEVRQLPAVPLENYERYVLRASLVGGTGEQAVYRVVSGTVVEDRSGPAMNLFQGRVALEPGDVAVTLEVNERSEPRSLRGAVSLDTIGSFLAVPVRLAGGGSGVFVIDLAATRSVVARQLLPEGTEIHPLVAIEHSERGVRRLEQRPTAAGGEAAGVPGLADLSELRLGDVPVPDLSVLVMDVPLQIGGREVVGIVGLDILKRAGQIALAYPRPGEPARLLLGPEVRPVEGSASVLPLTTVSRLLFVGGELNGRPVRCILDTGSRLSSLPPSLARAVGLTPVAGPPDTLRGLDGRPREARPLEPATLRLGGQRFTNVRFVEVELAVLSTLTEPACLLGQPFFRRLTRVVVDFVGGGVILDPGLGSGSAG